MKTRTDNFETDEADYYSIMIKSRKKLCFSVVVTSHVTPLTDSHKQREMMNTHTQPHTYTSANTNADKNHKHSKISTSITRTRIPLFVTSKCSTESSTITDMMVDNFHKINYVVPFDFCCRFFRFCCVMLCVMYRVRKSIEIQNDLLKSIQLLFVICMHLMLSAK